jgi:membrane protein implicated in regulation of membrane protease activity
MDRSSLARLIVDGFWVLVIGVIACFVFFVAIGGINPADSVGLSIVIGALVVLYLAHAWAQNHRKAEARDRRLVAARERRGF